MVCMLLGDYFGYIIQVALTVTSFTILFIKYTCDKEKRTFKVWLRDGIKQICGLAIAHIWNILYAIMLNDNITRDSDQCVMYFDNYIFDSTLGTFTTYLLLKLLTHLAKKYNWRYFVSGHYPTGIENKAWVLQILSWITIITVAKWCVFGIIVFPLRNYLSIAGNAILSPIIGYDNFELALVMIIIPLVFNTLQLIIQDIFIKFKHKEKDNVALDNYLLSNENHIPINIADIDSESVSVTL